MTGPLVPNYALGYGLVGGAYGTLPADYAQVSLFLEPDGALS